MKILFLNTLDSLGGAARAARRLHQGIRDNGIETRYLTFHKTSSDPSISGLSGNPGKFISEIWRRLDKIPLLSYPRQGRSLFSPSIMPTFLPKFSAAYNPDIVHLHWMNNGFLKVEELRQFRKPIVWTLHDSWPFTGGCHLPFNCTRYENSCGSCPQLSSNEEDDLSRWGWQRKQRTFADLNLNIITPSNWLANCARKSSLLKKFPIHVIPNFIDDRIFSPGDRAAARAKFHIPTDKKIILLIGMWLFGDANKGIPELEQALRILKDKYSMANVAVVIAGGPQPKKQIKLAFPVHLTGILSEEKDLAALYAAADVVATPSHSENLPNSILEAMACGTPAVAFNVGGIPDLIDHKTNGYRATPFSIEDFAAGLFWVLGNTTHSELRQNARTKIERNFSSKLTMEKHIHLYNNLLAKN